eukprot:1161214-Pelagomonas_calceolata.AAC.3
MQADGRFGTGLHCKDSLCIGGLPVLQRKACGLEEANGACNGHALAQACAWGLVWASRGLRNAAGPGVRSMHGTLLEWGNCVPALTLGGARLDCAESFNYSGMLFTKQRNPQATAEHMRAPLLAGCRRIRRFTSGFHLTDSLHTMLWLTKAYALPASMTVGMNLYSILLLSSSTSIRKMLQAVFLVKAGPQNVWLLAQPVVHEGIYRLGRREKKRES